MINLAAQYFGSVSDIEILWTSIAIVGILFSVHNLKNAIKDRRALNQLQQRNGRWIIAQMTIRMEGARLAMQAIYLSAGAMAMLLPDPPANLSRDQVIIGFLIRWGFVISAVLLTLKSYWTYQLRKILLNRSEFQDS